MLEFFAIVLKFNGKGFGFCTIPAGRHVFPRGLPIWIHDGLGLVIHVPMIVNEERWNAIVAPRLRAAAEHQVPPAPGPRDTADETSLMARRPQLARPPSSWSSSSSSTDTSVSVAPSADSTWQRTVVFSLQGQAHSLLLPWDDRQEMQTQVALALEFSADEIDRLHIVSHQPEDLTQMQLQCLLLQRNDEPRTQYNFVLGSPGY